MSNKKRNWKSAVLWLATALAAMVSKTLPVSFSWMKCECVGSIFQSTKQWKLRFGWKLLTKLAQLIKRLYNQLIHWSFFNGKLKHAQDILQWETFLRKSRKFSFIDSKALIFSFMLILRAVEKRSEKEKSLFPARPPPHPAVLAGFIGSRSSEGEESVATDLCVHQRVFRKKRASAP